MTGYVRQSIADIVTGEDITAPPINAEFNRLAASFDGATGHSHDGTTGNGPKINLLTSVTGVLPVDNGGSYGKNNIAATTNPTATDDVTKGYVPGSLWVNIAGGAPYIMVQSTAGAAVWRLIQSPTGTFLLPQNNLSDVADPAQSRANLGIAIGTNVQAYSDKLGNLASFATANAVPFMSSTTAYSTFLTTSFTRSLMNSAAAINFKTTLSLENVENTTDLNKPVSTATQAALNARVSPLEAKVAKIKNQNYKLALQYGS